MDFRFHKRLSIRDGEIMEQKTEKHSHFPWSHVLGFLLSIALTFLAVWVGLYTNLSIQTIVAFVFLLAFIQAAIQLFMFMHISEGEHKLWQIGKMIASGLIAIIIVVGSVWVLTSMH